MIWTLWTLPWIPNSSSLVCWEFGVGSLCVSYYINIFYSFFGSRAKSWNFLFSPFFRINHIHDFTRLLKNINSCTFRGQPLVITIDTILLFFKHFFSFLLLVEFFTSVDFHWSLSDRKSPYFYWTLLSILADLTARWLVWSRFFLWVLVLLFRLFPSAPTTISITITLMLHSFSSSLARSWYLSIFSFYFIFPICSAGTVKSTRC